jgi:UDP-glucose 4-epimerase
VTSGRILVTGGTGFLGSHLVHALVRDGGRVWVLARDTSRRDRLADLGDGVSYCCGDVTDPESLEVVCRDVNPATIFHLAGDTSGRRFERDWAQTKRAYEVNFIGTLNLVRAAATFGENLRCMVRTGGLEEYGAGPSPADEAQRERPNSPYSASQTAATHWCQMLQPHLRFSLVTLRPALIYGPGQSTDFLIPGLIEALLSGRNFSTSEGCQTRDLIYVDDVVSALRRVDGREDLRGAVINISTQQRHGIRDVIAQIALLLSREDLVEWGSAPPRFGDLRDVCGRNDLAERLLDWRPATNLAEGLNSTIAWYRDRHLLSELDTRAS